MNTIRISRPVVGFSVNCWFFLFFFFENPPHRSISPADTYLINVYTINTLHRRAFETATPVNQTRFCIYLSLLILSRANNQRFAEVRGTHTVRRSVSRFPFLYKSLQKYNITRAVFQKRRGATVHCRRIKRYIIIYTYIYMLTISSNAYNIHGHTRGQ